MIERYSLWYAGSTLGILAPRKHNLLVEQYRYFYYTRNLVSWILITSLDSKAVKQESSLPVDAGEFAQALLAIPYWRSFD